MSIERKRPRGKQSLDTVFEDSLENASDNKEDSDKSQEKSHKDDDSLEEVPSIQLTPCSRNLDVDVKHRNFTDDDIQINLNYSIFSMDSSFDDDSDSKYKRKRKDKGLTLNKSVANIRTPYNSEYLVSTWEDKVKNQYAQVKEKETKPKQPPVRQVFNYWIENNVVEESPSRNSDKLFKRQNRSSEKHKARQEDPPSVLSLSSSFAKCLVQTSDTADEPSTLEDQSSLLKFFDETAEKSSIKFETPSPWKKRWNTCDENIETCKIITQERNDLKTQLIEVIADAEKYKQLIKNTTWVIDVQTDMTGQIAPQSQIDEILNELRLKSAEVQKLNEEVKLTKAKEKAFLSKSNLLI